MIGQETINHVLVKSRRLHARPQPTHQHCGPLADAHRHLPPQTPTPRCGLFLCVWWCRHGGDWTQNHQSRPCCVTRAVQVSTPTTSTSLTPGRHRRTPASSVAYSKMRAVFVDYLMYVWSTLVRKRSITSLFCDGASTNVRLHHAPITDRCQMHICPVL